MYVEFETKYNIGDKLFWNKTDSLSPVQITELENVYFYPTRPKGKDKSISYKVKDLLTGYDHVLNECVLLNKEDIFKLYEF